MDGAAKQDLCRRLEEIKHSIYVADNEAVDAMFGGRDARVKYYEDQERAIDEAISIIQAL